MSKEDEKVGFSTRLWSGSAARERQVEEKVVSLPKTAGPGGRTYAAFETRANVSRLRIHRATQPSRYPNYNYLLDIVYDHDFQSIFTLIYSFMTVEVKGEYLESVVHAISAGSCESIHEFHRSLHDKPAEGEPLIEAIKVTAANEDEEEAQA